MKVSVPTVFKYLALPNALGGRGGVQRFFLLANNIPFAEDLIEMSDWGASEKERLISSGENPCGTVPVIYTKNDDDKDVTLIQHIAATRYLARLHGITKDITPYEEYVQDLVADEYQGFRDQWAKSAFSGSDEEKTTYREEAVPKYLTKFEKLYAKYKTDNVYLSVSKATGQPLWGDAAMFGLLRDNIITGLLSMNTLEASYPSLWKMYDAYGNLAPIKEWVDRYAAQN